jgi:ribosomal protein S18 acetylase RimI-like enzyme
MIDEVTLRARQASSQRGFYRALAAGSPDSRLLELPGGVQATIVPARPWFSIFNSVMCADDDALAPSLPELARAYDQAGVKAWTVWVPPENRRQAATLAEAGHVLDSTPMLMTAPLDMIDLAPRLDVDVDSEATWEEVAQCNDCAHGVLPDWSMAAVFSTMEDPATRRYAIRSEGHVVASLLAREQEGDCYLWFVATVPEAQRAGLSSELVRAALRDARDRGCTTTTLESTAMAEPVYERLGFRPLGRYEMWERRSEF